MDIMKIPLALLLISGLGLVFTGVYRLDKETGCIARALRRYGVWLEKQNAIFREHCRVRRVQYLYHQATDWFPIVAGLVHQSICDCAESIGAIVPYDMYRLANIPHIVINGKGIIEYRFRFRLRRGSSMSARDIERNLQSELDRNCYHHNIQRLIVHVTLTPDKIALLQVAWENDLMARQNKDLKI